MRLSRRLLIQSDLAAAAACLALGQVGKNCANRTL